MPKQCKKGAKVACIITGKTTYFGEQFLEKKLAKYGTLENFESAFICNAAKRMLRDGQTVEQIRAALDAPKDLPPIDVSILKKFCNRKKQVQVLEDATSLEELNKITEQQKQRALEFKNDIKEYGRFGAWVREYTYTPNGIGVCIRPDIFLNNDERCGKCEFFEHCLCRIWNGRKK